MKEQGFRTAEFFFSLADEAEEEKKAALLGTSIEVSQKQDFSFIKLIRSTS
jgi:hypothetical protein